MTTDNDMKGIPDVSEKRATSLQMPSAEHETCDVTSADVVPSMLNCRCVYADQEGIAKFSYLDAKGYEHTEVKYFSAGVMYPIRNINKVFRYYTGSTDTTSQIYLQDGSSVIGLKLRR